MTPQRQAYFNGMAQEEFEDRVMVLYFKSCITSWKKRLTNIRKQNSLHSDSIKLCEAMLRVNKKRLKRAKMKLPQRKETNQ